MKWFDFQISDDIVSFNPFTSRFDDTMKIFIIVIVGLLPWVGWSQEIADTEFVRGYEKPTLIKDAIDGFNRAEKLPPPAALTENEVVSALRFQTLYYTEERANHVKSLFKVIDLKILPKGSLIKMHRLDEKSDRMVIYLIFNLDIHPENEVPESDSEDIRYILPIRVNFK